mgnify:FL=1
MDKYKEYKDVSMGWLGRIPAHWTTVPLKYSIGKSPFSFVDGDWIESKVIESEGIRYLTTGNVGVINYKEQGNGFISDKTFRELNCTEVFPGDVLISRLNFPIGRSCIVPDLGYRIVVAVDNVIFRPDETKYNKKYLVYQMNCYPYSENANFIARGSTMQRITRTQLGALKLCVPPLEEQNAMVGFLDKKCSEIDNVISAQQKRIALLQELKQSVITHAVTKGLNPNLEMKDSGVEWIGEVPKHWEVAPIKRYANIFTGNTPSTKEERYYDSEDINWFTPGDFYKDTLIESNKKISEISRKENACRIFPPKSVYMIGIGGTIGKIATCEEEASANQQINIIVPNTYTDYKYLAYCMRCQKEEIILSANVVTLPIINQDKTGYLFMPHPQKTEQTSIVNYLDKKCASIDSTISKAQHQVELLQEYKQSLITEVVTGKRKVS